jgi:hypothetical protein
MREPGIGHLQPTDQAPITLSSKYGESLHFRLALRSPKIQGIALTCIICIGRRDLPEKR